MKFCLIIALLFSWFLTGCLNPLGDGKTTLPSEHRPGDPNLPVAVSDLNVSVGAGQAVLTWSTSKSVNAYIVKYKKVSESTYQVASSDALPPYAISNLENNIAYEFLIEAINQNGSAPSSGVAATPLPLPGSFSLTSATSGYRQGTLSWNPSAGASQYVLHFGTDSAALSEEIANVTSPVTITGLNEGSTYYFSVTAKNSSGETISNNTLSLSIAQTPSAPTLLSLVPGVNQATVTWSSADRATSYDIEYGNSPGNYLQTISNVTSPFVMTGLTNGQVINVRVIAVNSAGRTISANNLSATPNALPGSFAFTSNTPGNGFIDLAWSASTGATEYLVKWGVVSGVYSAGSMTVSSPSYRVTGLTNGLTYFFFVEAVNTIGRTNVTAETYQAPLAPPTTSSLSLVSIKSHEARLQWTASTGASSYSLQYGTTSGTYSQTLSNVTSPLTVSGLTNGTTYYFRVQAINSSGASNSTEVSATPIAPTLSFTTASQTKNENAGAATITVSSSQAPSSDLPISVSISGSGQNGVNYNYSAGTTITLSASSSSVNIPLNLLQDNLVSGNKTFIITLQSNSEYILGTTSVHTVTISDVDTYPVINLTSATASVSEEAASVTVTAQLSKSYGAVTSVSYSTTNGTAIAATDYQTTSGTLSFAAGETLKTFSIPLINNSSYYASRQFTTMIASPNLLSLGSTLTQTITINDDDPYSFLISSALVTNIDSCIAVDLTLTNASNVATGARVSTVANLNTSSGGGFYSNSSCTTDITSVTFASGESLKQYYFKATQAGTYILSAAATPTNLYIVAGGSGVHVKGPRSVIAGSSHSCAIGTNGQIYCWGVNVSGRLGDGTSVNWRFAPTAVNYTLPAGVTFVQLALASSASCGLLSNGNVMCWGYNSTGQLGDGTTTTKLSPVLVTGLGNEPVTLLQSQSGANNFCAVIRSYKVKCWGDNTLAQLGNGTLTSSSTPVDVSLNLPAGKSIISLAVGYSHACVVLSDNSIRCWGANGSSQLGDGTTTTATTPVNPGFSNIVDVFAGASTTCTLLSDSTANCWGANGYSSLANGVSGGSVATAYPLKTNSTTILTGIKKVYVGNSNIAALTDTALYLSGQNNKGQFLTFTSYVSQAYMAPVASAPLLSSVSVGNTGTVCGIKKSDDSIVCWGDSAHGQTGTTDSVNYFGFRPVLDSTLTNVSTIGLSDSHICAVDSAKAYCWGWGQASRLGLGHGNSVTTPALVKESNINTNMADVAVSTGATFGIGALSQCALTTDGLVKCWGYNNSGQIGAGDTASNIFYARTVKINSTTNLTNVTQISVGGYHVCAVNSSYQLFCWGQNGYGQVGNNGNPATNVLYATPIAPFDNIATKKVLRVSAGLYHTCVLLDNNDVRCWGRNSKGQLGDSTTTNLSVPPNSSPAGLTGFSKLSAGYEYTCGVKSNTIYCWGTNSSGQIGNNGAYNVNFLTPQAVTIADATSITEIQSYQGHTCAIVNTSTQTGKLYCWGANSAGTIGKNVVASYSTPQAITQYPAFTTPIVNVTKLSEGISALSTCFVTNTNSMQCSGTNTSSQMGDSSNPAHTTIYSVVVP